MLIYSVNHRETERPGMPERDVSKQKETKTGFKTIFVFGVPKVL